MINLWINSLGQEWVFFHWVCAALQSHFPALHLSSYSCSSFLNELSALNNLEVIEVIPFSQHSVWEIQREQSGEEQSAEGSSHLPAAALPMEGKTLPSGRAESKSLIWDTNVSVGLRNHSRMCFSLFPCPPYLKFNKYGCTFLMK